MAFLEWELERQRKRECEMPESAVRRRHEEDEEAGIVLANEVPAFARTKTGAWETEEADDEEAGRVESKAIGEGRGKDRANCDDTRSESEKRERRKKKNQQWKKKWYKKGRKEERRMRKKMRYRKAQRGKEKTNG